MARLEEIAGSIDLLITATGKMNSTCIHALIWNSTCIHVLICTCPYMELF